MDATRLDRFLKAERLPEAFGETLARICEPVADMAERMPRPAVLGLCGPQGAGKTTIAAAVALMLQDRGLTALPLSLDDFYLSAAARRRLGRGVHPLLAVRGPPGAHDLDLARQTLDGLAAGGAVRLPAFDKARDTGLPPDQWVEVQGPVDVVIFEGWCVGARPQPTADLALPINDLERESDADGRWRTYVNDRLAGPYRALWARLGGLVYLQAPGFEVVARWRAEQEQKLRARTGLGMDRAEIGRFVAHYERLTRWMLEEVPARADLTIRLDAERRPLP